MGASFYNAILTPLSSTQQFFRADLTSANFREANLTNVWFWDAELNYTSFYAADLTDASFYQSDYLINADFRYADLTRASLNHVDHLTDANFYRAVLTDAWFLGSDLQGADLSYTQACLLYTSPSPRDQRGSRMPSSA